MGCNPEFRNCSENVVLVGEVIAPDGEVGSSVSTPPE
jgi:hypothetical protein